MDFGESAVTPVIGTILVLAVAVAGIGVAVVVGAPVLRRMQEGAALEATVAQLQQLRAASGRLAAADSSMQMGVSLPGGDIAIVAGTHVMVTTYADSMFSTCDLRFLGWEDGVDKVVTFDFDELACRIPAVPTPPSTTACAPTLPGAAITLNGVNVPSPRFACLEAYRNGDFTDNQVDYVASAGQCVPAVGYIICPTAVTLESVVGRGEDWAFLLTNGEPVGDTDRLVYLESWLMHTDRVVWKRSSVAAYYELGAIFARSGKSVYLQAQPSFGERIPVAGGENEYFLRLPTWQGSTSSAFSGQGVYGIQVTLDGGEVRTSPDANGPDAESIRIDFQGDLASVWCRSLLQRNVGYAEDNSLLQGDPARTCSPASGSSDLVRGLIYDLPSGTPSRVLQQVFHGELQV